MATEVNQALAAHAQELLDEAAGRGQRAIDQVETDVEEFARLLVWQVRLRKALADPGLPPEPKRALLTELGGGRPGQARRGPVGPPAPPPRGPARGGGPAGRGGGGGGGAAARGAPAATGSWPRSAAPSSSTTSAGPGWPRP